MLFCSHEAHIGARCFGGDQVDDEVECKFSGVWRKGKVLQRMFRARTGGGFGSTLAPYMVRIENGPRMLVVTDDENFIRSSVSP